MELDLFLDCLNSSESALPSLFHLNLERTASGTGVRDEMWERILLINAYSSLVSTGFTLDASLDCDFNVILKDREV